ncbi:carbon-nitrogen hydrolase family protein [Litorivicinus sp.]|nr:carbon-nitrogen hydrolase family protein [Litorivicinus sp.]
MRISCVQYTAEPDLAISEGRLYPLMDEAVTAESEVILLPECALCLSSNQAISRAQALTIEAPKVNRLRHYAADHAVTLIVGSLIMATDQGVKNRTLVINPQGIIQATYDKIHLFDVDLASSESYRESALFDAGSSPTMTLIGDWTVGLSICFDLRFPALYRHYGLAGADLVVVPAAFTKTTGQAHWLTLLRARAIENGYFIVAAGQCGTTTDGRETYGHSVIYDPWGNCLGELSDEPGVLTVDLILDRVQEVRSSVPVMSQHRDFKA